MVASASNVKSLAITMTGEESSPSTASSLMSGIRLTLRRVLAALHAVVGVSAVAGSAALLSDPTGGALGFQTADLSGFETFAIPGALLGVLGIVQLAAAYVVTRPGAGAVSFSHYAGGLLVLWTAFQTALVAPMHPAQLVLMLTGTLIYSVAHELHRDEPHEPMLP